jgi:NADH dehydrogenase [ubiquinone] 1 alpha subcomplex assembly factor 7
MTETPLARKLKERIRREGPIGVDAYMRACLTDPEHGYYSRKAAIGGTGDFITAPEISQVFGELIGLWCAVVWRQMGAPSRLDLVELGPGRGTLMRDALRAARIVPGFFDALSLHLVDSNAALGEAQRATLAGAGVTLSFHDDAAALSDPARVPLGPAILIANEFLDALPIAQLEHRDGVWRERCVGLAADGSEQLTFSLGATVPPQPGLPSGDGPPEGAILETSEAQRALASDVLAARAGAGPLACLFIDYGHAATGFGDTLQGIAGHAHASPFHAPGETDLSAQVDFAQFVTACRDAGLGVDGPVPQAEFLGRLGIVERASRLMSANPSKAGAIEAGVQRLMAPNGMGSRFLAIGVRSADLAPLPGLA